MSHPLKVSWWIPWRAVVVIAFSAFILADAPSLSGFWEHVGVLISAVCIPVLLWFYRKVYGMVRARVLS